MKQNLITETNSHFSVLKCTCKTTVETQIFMYTQQNLCKWNWHISKSEDQTLQISITCTRKCKPMEQILLEKLAVAQLVTKFTASYGTQRFITAFTRFHLWHL